MKLLREWIEVLDICVIGRQQFALCATAAAYHDEMSSELVLYRDAFLKEATSYGPDEYLYPAWLPDADALHLLCEQAVALERAEREFKGWAALLQERMAARDSLPWVTRPADEDTAFEREMWDALAAV